MRGRIGLLAVLWLGSAVALSAAADGWLESHRKMKRGCPMGSGESVQRCYATGEALLERHVPLERPIVGACGTLGRDKAKLLCVEEMTDHMGPTPLNEIWTSCHRESGSVAEARRCLLNRLFPG